MLYALKDITFKPEWTYRNPQTGFRYRTGTLPPKIVYVSLHGKIHGISDIRESFLLVDKALAEGRFAGERIYVIADYTELEDAGSLEIKLFYARQVKRISKKHRVRAEQFIIGGTFMNKAAVKLFAAFVKQKIHLVESAAEAFGKIHALETGNTEPSEKNVISVTQQDVYELIALCGSLFWENEDDAPNRKSLVSPGNPLRELAEPLEAAGEIIADLITNYEGLLESSISGYIVSDTLTREIVFANSRALSILGVTREAITGQKCHDYLCPANESLRSRSGFCRPYEIQETKLLKPGGKEPIWVSISMTEKMFGNRACCIHSFVDITAHKQAEEKMLEFKAAVEQSVDGIAIADTHGRIRFVNKAWAEMHGYGADELVGRHLNVFHTREQVEKEVTAFNEKVLAHGSGESEIGHVRKDGTTFPTQMTATVLKGADGKPFGLIGIAHDITERKRLTENLQQTQKMEAIGRLAGGVAHDFNNMLQSIIGTAELAMMELDASSPLHADLEEIKRTGKRSADLTSKLLAFARKQTVVPVLLDFNKTVENMMKMLRRMIGENVRLVWNPGALPAPVRIDPTQVDQILTNLCINARDAITGTGTIFIETKSVTLDTEFCSRQDNLVPGPHLRLNVRDTGEGMDEETQSRLFEPFMTTRGSKKGTGLGLATVYGIVKQNRGHIAAQSVPGRGTEFEIYLPLEMFAGKPAAEDSAGAGAVPVARGSETVLLAEDEREVLRICSRFLEGAGYRVLAADTPAEALRLAEAHNVEIHLLVSDMVMPGMSGFDLHKRLIAQRPGMRTLFITGYSSHDFTAQNIAIDDFILLTKPFSKNDFLAKVRAALEKTGNTGK